MYSYVLRRFCCKKSLIITDFGHLFCTVTNQQNTIKKFDFILLLKYLFVSGLHPPYLLYVLYYALLHIYFNIFMDLD